jgi:hypothetical protein
MDFLTYTSAPGDQPRGFCHESVDVGQAFVPQVNGYVDDVRHEAEGRQRRVEKQGVQAAFVSIIWNRNFLYPVITILSKFISTFEHYSDHWWFHKIQYEEIVHKWRHGIRGRTNQRFYDDSSKVWAPKIVTMNEGGVKNDPKWNNVIYGWPFRSVLGTVPPAGHMSPAKHLNMAFEHFFRFSS